MTERVVRVRFDKEIPKEVEKGIQDELRAKAVIFNDEDPGLLRHKLKYLPVILRTTMYDVGIWTTSLEVAVKKVKKIGVADPTRNHEFYLFGFNSFKLGEEKARELCKKWIREDESRFDELVAKLPVKLRLANTYGEGGEGRHLAWPACTLELEEVRKEIDFLLNKPFLTMDNDYDMWIVEYGGYREAKEKGPEAINSNARVCGENFQAIFDVYKKYLVNFWFTFVWI